jgi:hypothetical protein
VGRREAARLVFAAFLCTLCGNFAGSRPWAAIHEADPLAEQAAAGRAPFKILGRHPAGADPRTQGAEEGEEHREHGGILP